MRRALPANLPDGPRSFCAFTVFRRSDTPTRIARSDETPEVAGITAVRMKITGMLADGPDNLPAHQMQPVKKIWRGARLRNAGHSDGWS